MEDVREQQWQVLLVNARSERKVANALRAKGFESFVPMHQVKRQWSDRLKCQILPLFSGFVFCRFSHVDRINVLNTIGICPSFRRDWQAKLVSDSDIRRLHSISSMNCEKSECLQPLVGQTVELIGDEVVRGILIDFGQICRVAVYFDSVGKTVCLHLPMEIIRIGSGSTSPQNYALLNL